MFEVLERSDRRLRVRLGARALTSICTFDLDRNSAEVAQFALRIPYSRKHITLSSLRDISVRRRSKRKIYQHVFELRPGEPITIGEYSKEDALKAAGEIRDFLRAAKANMGRMPDRPSA